MKKPILLMAGSSLFFSCTNNQKNDAKDRGVDNLMIVYWLYNRTGDQFLLELADLIHEQTFDYTYKYLETRMIREKRFKSIMKS
ncbi:MAG: hypothetical protein ACOC59_02840 [Bacteroidota bacterium]